MCELKVCKNLVRILQISPEESARKWNWNHSEQCTLNYLAFLMLKKMNNEIPFVPQTRREGDDIVQMCQKTFKSVLAIGPKRLFNLLQYLWKKNNPRPERRGEFLVKQGYAELKAEIINHIKKFKYHIRHTTVVTRHLTASHSLVRWVSVKCSWCSKMSMRDPLMLIMVFTMGFLWANSTSALAALRRMCVHSAQAIKCKNVPQRTLRKEGTCDRVIGSHVSGQEIISTVGHKARWLSSDHCVWFNTECCPSKIANWWGLCKTTSGLLFKHYRTQSDGQ